MSESSTERERGNALYLQGQYAEAAACYRAAIRQQPNDADAYNNLGAALADQGQMGEALVCYGEALRLRPGFAEAYYNLGNAQRLSGLLEPAIESYAHALRLRPGMAEAHNNLGIALRRAGRLAEALTSLRQAVQLKAEYPTALVNLGLTLYDLGRLPEALAHYEAALRLAPDQADAHHNRALAWLMLGDWKRGWAEYHWRWRCSEFSPPKFAQPQWDGSPLDGRMILLYTEQGMGDALQFVRYARLVRERGGNVVVSAPARLLPLLQGIEGIDRLVARDAEAAEAFDLHYPLMSVPALLGTTPDAVPAEVPYLRAEPRRIDHWRHELAALDGFRVGIAWRGSPTMLPYDRRRSIPLARFEPLARLEGVRLISVQLGPGVEEIPALGGRFSVLDLRDRLDETTGAFLDTAGVMMNLDLVVTCDTAIAHLAGGLGVPTWIALPSAPDWRWMLDGEVSPWYPTVRLFRQTAAGDWDDVFARIAEALRWRLRAVPGTLRHGPAET